MTDIDHYILEGRIPKQVPLMEWESWFEKTDNKRIKLTKLSGKVDISTVFLGIDHGFSGNEAVLFETMIFGGSELP